MEKNLKSLELVQSLRIDCKVPDSWKVCHCHATYQTRIYEVYNGITSEHQRLINSECTQGKTLCKIFKIEKLAENGDPSDFTLQKRQDYS